MINPAERQRWIETVQKINANLVVNDETVLGERHWPDDYETVWRIGHLRPKHPPSVFTGFISMTQSPPRPTKKASSQFRNLFPDELKQFELKDRVDFTKLKEISVKHKFCASIISFISEHNLVIWKMAHWIKIIRCS